MQNARIAAVCDVLSEEYTADSVQIIRDRLFAEPEPYTCLSALEQFLDSGSCTILSWGQISTLFLTRELGMEYPDAVAVLLWLEQQPEEALAALNYYFL